MEIRAGRDLLLLDGPGRDVFFSLPFEHTLKDRLTNEVDSARTDLREVRDRLRKRSGLLWCIFLRLDDVR